MKSAKESVSATAVLALALAIARIASPPLAVPHRLGPVTEPFLAIPGTSVTAISPGPADDGSGDGDDGDEDDGDGSS